ncbi:MAG: 3-hydroxybutyrate dehydrogenase [Pseudomonadota bacterium]
MLTGKTALVTGSTSGIGRAIAEAFAQQGANVILNGFGDPGEIETLRSALAARHDVQVSYDGADLSDCAAIEAMMARALGQFGRVDILVNNAGIQHVAPVDDFPLEKWNAILALNLSASFHTVRLALPGMKANGWGRIVNVASAHALVASPFKSAYVAAKHGVAGFTKAVALEVATAGITMNAICPGYVWTALLERQIPETAKARGMSNQQVIQEVLLHAQPTRQFVTVDQVAALACFLVSEQGASMTGAVIPMDGGWTAQ